MSFRCSGFYHSQTWVSIKKNKKILQTNFVLFISFRCCNTHRDRFTLIGQSKSTRQMTLKYTNPGFRTSYRKMVQVRFEPNIFLFSGFPHNLFRYLSLLNFRVNLLYQFIFCKVITNIHKIHSSRKYSFGPFLRVTIPLNILN